MLTICRYVEGARIEDKRFYGKAFLATHTYTHTWAVASELWMSNLLSRIGAIRALLSPSPAHLCGAFGYTLFSSPYPEFEEVGVSGMSSVLVVPRLHEPACPIKPSTNTTTGITVIAEATPNDHIMVDQRPCSCSTRTSSVLRWPRWRRRHWRCQTPACTTPWLPGTSLQSARSCRKAN